jgi:hypothetical protein
LTNVDEQAIECLKLETAGTRDTETLKNKEAKRLDLTSMSSHARQDERSFSIECI